MNYAQGVDVSKYQAKIDWNLLGQSKSFAFIRATSGTNYQDPTFVYNWNEAGIYKGAYHYVKDNQDAVKQANYLLSVLDGDYGQLPIALDAELITNKSMDTVIQTTVRMAMYLREKVDHRIAVYTSAGVWNVDTPIDEFIECWTANWGVKIPRIPIGWHTWSFWQYEVSKKGDVPGIPYQRCDLDYFNGTKADLDLYVQGKPMPPKPKDKAMCIVYSLRVRDKPSVRGRVVGSMSKNQVFDVGEEVVTQGSEVWLRIKDEEKYVAMLYAGNYLCMYV